MNDYETSVDQDAGNDYLAERASAISREKDPDVWLDSMLAGSERQSQSSASNPVRSWLGQEPSALATVIGFGRDAADAAIDVAKDVFKGTVIEGPGAITRGATAAINNFGETYASFANWLYEAQPDVIKGGALDLTAKIRTVDPNFQPGDVTLRLPQVFNERDTTTGELVEYAAQWLTSEALAGKVTKALGVAPSIYKRVVDSFLGGAAGFDPKQPRLSNMIQDITPNSLTDFLQADSEDPELLARLKSGLETGGLQGVSEGVIRALRVIRSAMRRDAGGSPDAANGAQTGGIATGSSGTGVTGANISMMPPAVQMADDIAEKADRFLRGETLDVPVKVNIERFEGPAQIKAAITDLAGMLPEDKTISMDVTLAQARSMGITPQQLQSGLDGQIFDRRQIAAGWMMFRSSADDLVKLADQARATGAPADLARFNAAFQTSYGILQTVKGQSAEIARALQIHAALRKSEPGMVKALQSMLEDAGGADVAMDIAEKIATLKDPALAGRFVAEAGKAKSRDQLLYIYSNILMSNPATQVVNVGDTMVSTFMQVPETWFASKFGGNVAAGEATAKLYGIAQGYRDGLRYAWRSLRSGQDAFALERGGAGTTEIPGRTAFANSEGLAQGGNATRFGDYLKMMIPTRLSMAGDQLAKVANFRGEMHALAWREAVIKQGLDGQEAAAYAAKLVNDAPDWLNAAAEAQAIKGSFNEMLQGRAAPAFSKLVNAIDLPVAPGVSLPVGRVMFAAFVRTPINIFRWTVHRTPGAFISPKIQAELMAGGASRDMALGRIAVGSTIMSSFADLTISGRITGAGPKDPEQRAALMRTGWQPYSFKAGDTWYSYNRSGTVGSLVGIAADATELLSGVYNRPGDTVTVDGEPVEDSVATSVTIPFANAVLSKVYMQQLSQFVDALSDPTRYGEGYFKRMAGSLVPAVLGAVERTVDPEVRRAQDWMETVRSRVPGLSNSLTPRLNLWGEPIKDENGIYNLFLPSRMSEAKGSGIDGEIARMRLDISPPRQIVNFGSQRMTQPVQLSPEIHNRYIALAGNELKLPVPGVSMPMGAKDYLNAIVEGNAGAISQRYANGSDELRELIIKDVITRFRAAARATVLKDAPDVLDIVQGRMRTEAEKIKTPRGAPPRLQ